jgi:hypothetical protein
MQPASQLPTHCGPSGSPLHSVHLPGVMTYNLPLCEIALFGHSRSQAPHPVHWSVIIFIAMMVNNLSAARNSAHVPSSVLPPSQSVEQTDILSRVDLCVVPTRMSSRRTPTHVDGSAVESSKVFPPLSWTMMLPGFRSTRRLLPAASTPAGLRALAVDPARRGRQRPNVSAHGAIGNGGSWRFGRVLTTAACRRVRSGRVYRPD